MSRKEGTSGRAKEMASKVAKPAVLSAEAAAMEQKLAELRKAMEKERAKREALMSNMGGGSIWRNGNSNIGLRTNIKGRGPGEATSISGGSASTNSASAAAKRPGSRDTPGREPGSSSSQGPAAARASSARTASETDMPSVSGSRLVTNTSAAATHSNAQQAAGSSKADILDLQGSRSSVGASRSGGGGSSSGARPASGGGGGGMSCGTDDGPSLATGAFNEADSHRSFLEALNEWRRANRGQAPAEESSSGAAASSGGAAASGGRPRSAAAVSSSTLEVQTEARSASRPSSAKPLSYFDKLVINTTSRQAGHLAAGEPPETVRASLSGQSSYVLRPGSKGAAQPTTPPLSNATASATAASATVPGKAMAAAEPAAAATKPQMAPPLVSTNPPVALAAGAGAAGGDASDPLSILDRLEALERQRQAQSHADEDDDTDAGPISITTANGLVLTKGVRLPDEVLVPPNEGC